MFQNQNLMMGGTQMMQQPLQQVYNDWPTNQLIIHPQNFSFNAQNIPVPNFPVWMPEVQNAIPTIAAAVANEICRTATQNTIRVYTYNQLSANNFNNPDFAQTVQLAVDLVSLATKKRGGFAAFNKDAADCVKDAIVIKGSMNVANSQALASTLPPPTMRDVNNTLLMFKNDAAQIEQLRNAAMNQPQAQVRGNFNNPLGNPTMMQNQNNGFVPQQFNQPVQQQQPQYWQPQQNQFQPTQFGNQPQNNNPSGYKPVSPVSPNSMNVVARDFFYQEFVPIQPANQFAAPSNQNQNAYTPVTNFEPVPEPVAAVPAPQPVQVTRTIPPAPPPMNWKAGIIESFDSTPEPGKAQHQAFKMPEIHQPTQQSNDELSAALEQATAELQSPVLDFAQPGIPVKVIETNEELQWWPSELQPFPIYWESLKEKIILKKVSYKGKIFVVQQKTNLTEEEMDEMRHAIGPKTIMDKAVLDQQRERLIEVVGLEEGRTARTGPKVEVIDGATTITHSANPTTQDELEGFMESKGQVMPKDPTMSAFPSVLKLAGLDKDPTQSLDADGDPAWFDAGFLADSIYSTKVRHLTMANSHKRIRREYHIVPKVFVSRKPLVDIYSEWTEKKEFSFLADKLRKTVTGDKLATTDYVEFAAEFDRYLTSIINEFMPSTLHVATTIDSFCEDIDTLMSGYLREKYGPFIHDALVGYQQEFYDRYLTRIEDEEMLKTITEMHVKVDDVDMNIDTRDTHVLVLENNYSISSVRVHSSELKLVDTKSSDTTPTPIGDDRPELKAFCEKLFESKIIGEFSWAKHLLITSDGQVYSVEKPSVGYIKYMIRKLNPMWLMP